MATKDNFFRTSDDAILYYEDHSPEKGAPIVLVPGYCCTTHYYDNNIPGLAKDHRVITFDPRGQGASSKGLQGHTVARNTQDIRELLDYLEVEDAVLLGWSMAGQFIVKYFDMYGAHRIKALGLIDCPLGAMYDEPWNAHGLKGFNTTHFTDQIKMVYNGWEGYCNYFCHLMYDGNDDSKVDWSTQQMTQTPPWIAFAIYSDMTMTNCYELLEKIDIPMVFFGADGKVTANGRELAARWWPEGAKNSPYTESYPFDHGGHVFFDVYPEEFNEKLLHFMESLKKL